MEKVIQFIKGFVFSLILFLLYFYIGPSLLYLVFKGGMNSSNIILSTLSSFLLYTLNFLIIMVILRKDIIKQGKEFIKDRKSILSKGFNNWIYGVIIMFISNLIIVSIVGSTAVNQTETQNILLAEPLVAIPRIILFGPVLEEIIFRFGLRKCFNKRMTYAIFSGAIFGLLHITTALDSFTISEIISHLSEFLFLVPYGSLGFYFALSYYDTDNIFSSIIPHMLHNTLSVALILLTSLLGVV